MNLIDITKSCFRGLNAELRYSKEDLVRNVVRSAIFEYMIDDVSEYYNGSLKYHNDINIARLLVRQVNEEVVNIQLEIVEEDTNWVMIKGTIHRDIIVAAKRALNEETPAEPADNTGDVN